MERKKTSISCWPFRTPTPAVTAQYLFCRSGCKSCGGLLCDCCGCQRSKNEPATQVSHQIYWNGRVKVYQGFVDQYQRPKFLTFAPHVCMHGLNNLQRCLKSSAGIWGHRSSLPYDGCAEQPGSGRWGERHGHGSSTASGVHSNKYLCSCSRTQSLTFPRNHISEAVRWLKYGGASASCSFHHCLLL